MPKAIPTLPKQQKTSTQKQRVIAKGNPDPSETTKKFKMITCTKLYDSIPFAHRQHMHDGHCAYIHGHNWGISITFGCENTDENDFVVDFGKLKFIKAWIEENLDHACVLSESDPLREEIYKSVPCAYKAYVVESCSCEGLAKHLFEVFDVMVRERTNNRAFVQQISISEDEKNTACYSRG